MRLGRLPHDPAILAKLATYKFGAVEPPATLDRRDVNFLPRLYQNDTLPDCTAVALANGARAVSALNGYQLSVNAARVPAFYSDCIGNPPDLAATDGAAVIDVLHHQSAKGFNIGYQLLVGNYRQTELGRAALALTMARFGFGYWGIVLHERDMDTANAATPWEISANDGTEVGGHCVIGFDYLGLGDKDLVRIGTWGAWKSATWAWVEARMEESYALMFRQLVRADGTFYNGVSMGVLLAEF